MNNAEHEIAVLAAIKRKPLLFDSLRLRADDFYSADNRRTFEAVSTLLTDGLGVDDITLTDKGAPMAVVVGLSKVYPSEYNAEYYAKSLREMSKLRRLSALAERVTLEVADGHDSEHVIDKLEHLLIDLAAETDGDWVWAQTVVKEAVAEIEADYHSKGLRGLSTGIRGIDQYLGGMEGGDYVVIAARPSIGKTALALSMIVRMILDLKYSVGLFSCEMSRKQIGKRLLSMIGRLNLAKIRSGTMSPADFNSLNDASTALHETTLALDDTPNIGLTELRSKARQMARHGVQCVFVDYLTLVRHGDMRMSRPERVGEVSKQLKGLARELDIPVVALSQVNRDAEDKVPGLETLRQSGEIEEDADVVMFLHRERDAEDTILRVAKNRNGPTGDAELRFERSFVRYTEGVM